MFVLSFFFCILLYCCMCLLMMVLMLVDDFDLVVGFVLDPSAWVLSEQALSGLVID